MQPNVSASRCRGQPRRRLRAVHRPVSLAGAAVRASLDFQKTTGSMAIAVASPRPVAVGSGSWIRPVSHAGALRLSPPLSAPGLFARGLAGELEVQSKVPKPPNEQAQKRQINRSWSSVAGTAHRRTRSARRRSGAGAGRARTHGLPAAQEPARTGLARPGIRPARALPACHTGNLSGDQHRAAQGPPRLPSDQRGPGCSARVARQRQRRFAQRIAGAGGNTGFDAKCAGRVGLAFVMHAISGAGGTVTLSLLFAAALEAAFGRRQP